MSIFLITLVEYPKTYEHPDCNGQTRCVGYFSAFLNATKAIEENKCDYNEYKWDFIVIEEVYQGIWVTPVNEYWYKWNIDTKTFLQCNKPSCFYGTTGFGIG